MDILDKPATHAWTEIPPGEVSDAIVAAMALGGVDHLFFTSGAEIAFYQEAIAKAQAHDRPAPRLITMTHEHASLNAALGYAAVSGKPVATAAHVDAGTLNYGGAIHTAAHANLPVLITAGGPPVAFPGSMRGARDRGGHLWQQQSFDQNGIVRNYVKWDHRLEYQDNPGLIVSRALQVARSEQSGPVYLSLPREIALMHAEATTFPSADQLGIVRGPAPDPAAVRTIATRLMAARNPFVVVSGSGRNPATVPLLVELCELLAIGVTNSSQRDTLCFPKNHPLWLGRAGLHEADVVLALEANVPWVPGPQAPPDDAFVAVAGIDPLKARTPTYEFTADLRLLAGAEQTLNALLEIVRDEAGSSDRGRIAERRARYDAAATERDAARERDAATRATSNPIDPLWLSHEIGAFVDDNTIVFDETLPGNQLDSYMRCSRPGSMFANPASSGGWSVGAAFGGKLAAPDRDVIATTGDGFYMFSTANAALWSSWHYNAPITVIVYQNRSYSTGTIHVTDAYPHSYAAAGGFEGGTFDPPIDFAKEAEAAGAYGENVRDPAEILPALHRARHANREGRPAVVSVWLKKAFGD